MNTISDSLVERHSDSHLTRDGGDSIDVTSDVGLSGVLIRLARNGKLPQVIKLFRAYQRVQTALANVEFDLRGCNHSMAVDFASRCLARKRDFESEIRALATRRELEKVKLHAELTALKEQLELAGVPIATFPDWVVPFGTKTLTLRTQRRTRHSPIIASRNAAIEKGLDKGLSVLDICRQMDFEFVSREGPPREVPKPWHKFGVMTFTGAYMNEECRPLVFAMIQRCIKQRTHH
jgi:hypothetical protein